MSDHHHAHDHHDHVHGDARVKRDVLERDAGSGKILFLDAPSGLAGDMIIAALVDLGVPEHVIVEAASVLSLHGFHLHFGTRERSGIVATAFDVHVDAAQPERTYGAIRTMLDESELSPGIKARAQATFRRLAESEARVHGMPPDDVHLHEVGAVDAIVDVVGSAAALDYLGARLVVSPLPMGHGWVKARHGILPLPPPAVVECLQGFPTYDAGVAFELVTPTGAAIVGAHAESTTRWPTFSPERTGWGAGTATLADRPNLLRAVLGTPVAHASGPSASHVVVEANIDDATGELLGHCIDALFAGGALDAWAVPLVMKKGRPAFQLGALAPLALRDAIAAIMLRESTTIGVRHYEVARIERPRRVEHVSTPFGVIPVKIAEDAFGPPLRKPEFDACLAAARNHRVPLRVVIEAAAAEAALADSRVR
ncbi:MAG: nickel pincer cofactor biosynthesis protein LarC [Polyangiaceae bacterium]|nr:nickel pincer cofactor biosynthesis protein LarC [Polyangiaceae bacterium]